MLRKKHEFKEHWQRSLAKTVSYRVVIVILDFSIVYLLTGRYEIALIFTVASNSYSSIAYYVHERAWDRISWGKRKHRRKPANA